MLSTYLGWVSLAIALVAAVLSWVAVSLALRPTLQRRDFRAIQLHVAELEDLHEALSASHKRLRSRVGMRELRAKKKTGVDGDPAIDEDPPPVDTDKWKKDMRLRLHRGEIKA